MATRLAAMVVGSLFVVACSDRKAAGPPPPGSDAGDVTCEPAPEDRGLCRRPVDTTLCATTWDARPAPMCGLRIYEGPGAGYLLQYVSLADVPPVGGPSWMCVYDPQSHALVGAWALDHYPRWCCGTSLDMFQGVGSNEIASVAVAMASHPPCPDAGP